MEQYQEDFKKRVKNHINLVNKYAKKIGHVYPYHDHDKLQGELFIPYSLSMKNGYKYETYEGLSDDDKEIYNKATIKHITNNPHHPEFFLKKDDLERLQSFTRENPPMNLNCSLMSDGGIIEMCCDWCAMAEEFGNTPYEWFDKTCGYLKYDDYNPPVRWKFTNHQMDLIEDTLTELWGSRYDQSV